MLVFYRGIFTQHYTECRVMMGKTCGELHSLPSP
uniref:Uncharacterized protein n=1 Tax=Siphoviridae sp. ct0eR1 TaxID=2825297 RepID=A0A8S5UHD2_9CAUD|nr:MAG TPA: hypothetical protein [Siphoviridae sp. ct0eR1]